MPKTKKKKYLLPLCPDAERALRHIAVDRRMTVAETIVEAIIEMGVREGWLARVDSDGSEGQ